MLEDARIEHSIKPLGHQAQYCTCPRREVLVAGRWASAPGTSARPTAAANALESASGPKRFLLRMRVAAVAITMVTMDNKSTRRIGAPLESDPERGVRVRSSGDPEPGVRRGWPSIAPNPAPIF